MTDAQRGVKKTLMDKWRTALADLRLLADLSMGEGGNRWLTPDDIRRVLGRDRLAEIVKAGVAAQDEQERRKYADAILEAVSKVSELDLSDVPPTSHPLELVNRFGDDEPHESLTLEQAFANAPARERDLFKVPPTV